MYDYTDSWYPHLYYSNSYFPHWSSTNYLAFEITPTETISSVEIKATVEYSGFGGDMIFLVIVLPFIFCFSIIFIVVCCVLRCKRRDNFLLVNHTNPASNQALYPTNPPPVYVPVNPPPQYIQTLPPPAYGPVNPPLQYIPPPQY